MMMDEEKLKFFELMGIKPNVNKLFNESNNENKQLLTRKLSVASSDTAIEDLESINSDKSTKIKRSLLYQIPFFLILNRNLSTIGNENSYSLRKRTKYVGFDYEDYCNKSKDNGGKNHDKTIDEIIDEFNLDAQTKIQNSILNRRSRRLKRLMTPCTVNVIKLNEIDYNVIKLSKETQAFLERLKKQPKTNNKSTNNIEILQNNRNKLNEKTPPKAIKPLSQQNKKENNSRILESPINSVFSNGAALAANPNLTLFKTPFKQNQILSFGSQTIIKKDVLSSPKLQQPTLNKFLFDTTINFEKLNIKTKSQKIRDISPIIPPSYHLSKKSSTNNDGKLLDKFLLNFYSSKRKKDKLSQEPGSFYKNYLQKTQAKQLINKSTVVTKTTTSKAEIIDLTIDSDGNEDDDDDDDSGYSYRSNCLSNSIK